MDVIWNNWKRHLLDIYPLQQYHQLISVSPLLLESQRTCALLQFCSVTLGIAVPWYNHWRLLQSPQLLLRLEWPSLQSSHDSLHRLHFLALLEQQEITEVNTDICVCVTTTLSSNLTAVTAMYNMCRHQKQVTIIIQLFKTTTTELMNYSVMYHKFTSQQRKGPEFFSCVFMHKTYSSAFWIHMVMEKIQDIRAVFSF